MIDFLGSLGFETNAALLLKGFIGKLPIQVGINKAFVLNMGFGIGNKSGYLKVWKFLESGKIGFGSSLGNKSSFQTLDTPNTYAVYRMELWSG